MPIVHQPPEPDAEKLASWLIDGAREILTAAAALDSFAVPREADDGVAYTTAARIAKLHEAKHDADQAIITDLREALEAIVRNDKTVYDYGSTRDAPNRNGEQPAQGQRWRTPREIAQAALSSNPCAAQTPKDQIPAFADKPCGYCRGTGWRTTACRPDATTIPCDRCVSGRELYDGHPEIDG